MWPDRVSNPGPLTYESGAYRLRYAVGVVLGEKIFEILYHNKCSPYWLCDLSWVFFFSGKIGSWNVLGENIQAL